MTKKQQRTNASPKKQVATKQSLAFIDTSNPEKAMGLYEVKLGRNWSEPLDLDRITIWRDTKLLDGSEKMRLAGLKKAKVTTVNDTLPPQILASVSGKISTGKTVLENAKKGAETMAKFSKKASKKAEYLNDAEDLLKMAAGLGKLASGLGALGAGLGLLDTILNYGKPSDTDRLLDAISGVGDQINAMENKMDARFNHLENKVDLGNANSDMASARHTLLTLARYLQTYSQNQNSGHLFDKLDIFEISKAIVSISDISSKLFPSLVSTSMGDLKLVNDIGIELFYLLSQSMVGIGLIKALQLKKDGWPEDDALKEAQRVVSSLKHEGDLEDVHGAWKIAVNDCLKNPPTYAQEKLDMLIGSLKGTNREMATELNAVLLKQWPQYDWLSIVYDGKTDPNTQMHTKGNDAKGYFSVEKLHASNGKDIIAYAALNTKPVLGGNMSTVAIAREYWGERVSNVMGGGSSRNIRNAAQKRRLDLEKKGTFNRVLKRARWTGPAEWWDWNYIWKLPINLKTNPSPGFVWACRIGRNACGICSNPKRLKAAKGWPFTVMIYK